jgi:hypothetical protein
VGEALKFYRCRAELLTLSGAAKENVPKKQKECFGQFRAPILLG